MTTVAEICVELVCIGRPHALDPRNHISVPVFVHFGDGSVIQVGPLMGKDDHPVRPPRYK